MLDREQRRDALGRGLLYLHPNWVQLVTRSGVVLYMLREPPFTLTTAFQPAPVSGTCGGFLCDEMGLGKTLESLMLVLANPAPEGWALPAPAADHTQDVPEATPSKKPARSSSAGSPGSSQVQQEEQPLQSQPAKRGRRNKQQQQQQAAKAAGTEEGSSSAQPAAAAKASSKSGKGDRDTEPDPIKTTLLVVSWI